MRKKNANVYVKKVKEKRRNKKEEEKEKRKGRRRKGERIGRREEFFFPPPHLNIAPHIHLTLPSFVLRPPPTLPLPSLRKQEEKEKEEDMEVEIRQSTVCDIFTGVQEIAFHDISRILTAL